MRQVLIFKRPPGCAGLSLSASLCSSGALAQQQTAAVHADRAFHSIWHVPRGLPPSPSLSLLLLLPAAFTAHRYCRLSGRRFWRSSAPVSQLIRGCRYFGSIFRSPTVRRSCFLARQGFPLLRDTGAAEIPSSVDLLINERSACDTGLGRSSYI